MKALHACLAAYAVLLAACQTVPYEASITDDYMYSRWLPAVEDRKSTREYVMDKLGNPSKNYEQGRIAVYRLIIHEWENGMSEGQYKSAATGKYYSRGAVDKSRFDALQANGRLLVLTDENENRYQKEIIASVVEFHLILVYDSDGIVQRHSLVRRQP